MKPHALPFIGVLALAFGLAVSEARACTLQPPAVSPGAVTFVYNAFDPAAAVNTVDVTLTNSGATPCNIRLAAESFASTDFRMTGPATLAYEMLAPGGTPLQSSSSALDGIARTVPASGTITVTLTLRIAAGQIVGPGFYQDTVELRLFDAGTLGLLQSRALIVSAIVTPQAQVAVVGTGPGDVVDFGDLAEGVERSVQVYLRGNTNLTVTFVSANRATLRHQALPGSRPIPYATTFGGVALNLSGGIAQVTRSLAALSAENGRFPLAFTIGSTQGSAPGLHTDTVQIVVVPNP